MKDQAGSGSFCLSLVNGVGPAVQMTDCAAATSWELWWYSVTPSQVLSGNQNTFRIHSTSAPALCLFGPDGRTTGQDEFYTALPCSDAATSTQPGFIFGIRTGGPQPDGPGAWQKPAGC